MMVATATKIEWQVLKSDLEAILVEAELIRVHQPEFNVLLKDDKTPLYIQITEEEFPRVLTVRKKEFLTKKLTGTILGPFPSAYKVKEVLRIVRPIFPWCNQSPKKNSACFYYHLQQCSGACVNQVNAEEYQQMINQLVLFLRGKTKQVTQTISAELQQAAKNQEYEAAAELRDRLKLIEDVTSIKKKLTPDLSLPQLQPTLAEERLKQLSHILATYLKIPRNYRLGRIEGYDVSNIQGTSPTVAMVTFLDGQPDPSQYRLFNIRGAHTPNDYRMMKEAIFRRQNHPEWGEPNLVVIDGGRGQVRAALSMWQKDTPLIGIAKNPDRLVIPITHKNSAGERQILDYHLVKLGSDHPALQLIQSIRDEAHRFSKKQHHRLRMRVLLREIK